MRSIASLIVLVVGLPAFAAGPRDEQWKKVDEAMQKGLPKTAIEQLGPIIAGAIQDKAYAEAIKAIGKKIALEGNIQGNKPEEKIVRLQAEIAKAPKEMVPMMEAVLANWYWHYFQQNRWRFMQRTATAQPPSNDFTTWDLPRILAEIDRHYTEAIKAEEQLKATAVSAYDDLLQKGTVPDTYRPMMFDFVAHEALQFYIAGEQAGAKAQDAFDLRADSPIFASAEEFIAWQPETTDENSLTLKAIRLYQKLLKFHQGDEGKTAFIDADLLRLTFGYNKAFGEEKNERYKAALKRFTDKWGDHEIAARALHAWARVLQQEGDLVEARKLAERGKNAFPDSVGGRSCHNLILEIEAKSSQVTTERVWNQPLSKIQVHYRNVTKVFLRAVPYSYEERLKTARYRPEQLDQNGRPAVLAKEPARQWAVDLPPTEDYQQRTEDVTPPADLKPGFYFLLASHDPGFGDQNNVVSFADFWVSDLALVIRTRHGEAKAEGFVLNAISGEPIENATVQVWYHTQNNTRVAGPTAKSDKNGFFSTAVTTNQSYLLFARHGDQTLATANDYHGYQGDFRSRPVTRTIFFTDRSLYRPGQTIHYKGICIDIDQDQDNYKTIARRVLNVVFVDGNNKEIERLQHQTNDYGSFSGSFTAPRDRLTGRMTIRVDGEPGGATAFNVEEYKRPKFQAVVERPEVAPKLNDQVTVKGRATAYTGAAIGNAQVRYRVVRQVRYPIWWRWYYWFPTPQSGGQEITHGTTTTGADGAFTIQFVAKPDLSVAEKDEPVFEFQVYADVTDTTGETRSGQQTVRVGYTALQASLTAEEWQTADKPVQMTIKTTTLDGEGQQSEGSLKICRLKPPETVQRQELSGHPYPQPRFGRGAVPGKVKEPEPDLSDPNSWPLGEMVVEHGYTTDAEGNASFSQKLEAGAYRALIETQDRFGKKVTAKLPIQVVDPAANRFAIKVPYSLTTPTWTVEPGQEFLALWGSGYDQARAYIEIEHRRKVVQGFWTDPATTQVAVKQAVTEAMRGGFTLHVTMVRENRAYTTSQKVTVPWTNKKLTVAWSHFVSKLEPAQKETWTAVITGPDAKKAVAEMVAAMYDASLDAYLPHGWPQGFGVFREDHSGIAFRFENMLKSLQHLHGNWPQDYKDASMSYRSFPAEIVANLWGYQYFGRNRGGLGAGGGARFFGAPAAAAPGAPPAPEMARRALQMDRLAEGEVAAAADKAGGMANAMADARAEKKQAGQAAAEAPAPDLSKVSARQNLNETAFFFPHLLSDKDGEVKLEFTMPEALTEWKFLGFAHDQDLRSGFLQDKVVTAKDLMVEPNPPRFLREGDVLEFTVKVSNQSPTRQTGAVRLTLADARTARPMDAALGNTTTDQAFDIPSKESRSVSWRLTVPDGAGFLTYKAVGSTGKLSDGEEGFLPVLSRRILVTESLPLPIRGAQTKKFEFTKLLQSGKSDTLRHQSVTVQMVSNPAWYAVMALPYLMEFPYECTEQTFNRLYANSLARHIAKSDPKIRRVFDQWKGTPALDSPLFKNQDLKAVLIEETPWLRQAQAESQARRNVGILFDDNRLNDETARLLRKLTEQQLADGRWPWFPGGPPNDYITLYIATGFGRLRHLGADLDVAPATKALARLDAWVDEQYRWILAHSKKEDNHLSTTIAFYLYGRSFFLQDKAIDAKHKEAVDYFLGQARKYWLELAHRQSQAHLAIALKRFGDQETAQAIMRSIKERSVSDEELGMFWRDLELSWWWYRAPIETQAMMIEAFDEVMNDAESVEACKVWLLKQKQTQDWKTSKATADAVYGLLLRGTDVLASDELVQVSLAGVTIEPGNVEAGTGFYEKRFTGPEIKPQLGEITVKKVDQGVAWGSVHWQYLEDMTKVTPYEGTPLKLQKQIFTKVYTKQGPVIQPVAGPVKVGDELVSRIVLRVDRDMEYVHLKDYRGSGTEPVNVLSQYKYQDGLAYYEATRDTASHFFIDYLPKGVYVFEYSVRVQHKGQYQTGMAQIQCMYAPEFNSHSESIGLVVQ
jgi:uncharacterized protein YfaS (alpha-2-macroglobulin family)